MGVLCTEFVKLSVGVGRRWREERRSHKLGVLPFWARSAQTHSVARTFARGNCTATATATNTNTGSRKLGEFTTEEESFCSERAFKYEIEILDFMISQGKRVERIQLLTNQACEGAKKRENPWRCSSTDFKPPEPSACVVTETGVEKGPQESLSTETMAPY